MVEKVGYVHFNEKMLKDNSKLIFYQNILNYMNSTVLEF